MTFVIILLHICIYALIAVSAFLFILSLGWSISALILGWLNERDILSKADKIAIRVCLEYALIDTFLIFILILLEKVLTF